MLAHVVLGIGVGLVAFLPLPAPQDNRSNEADQARTVSSEGPEIRPRPPELDHRDHEAADADKKDDAGPMSPVPEPGTLAIVGAGLLLIALLLRRRNRELGVEPNG